MPETPPETATEPQVATDAVVLAVIMAADARAHAAEQQARAAEARAQAAEARAQAAHEATDLAMQMLDEETPEETTASPVVPVETKMINPPMHVSLTPSANASKRKVPVTRVMEVILAEFTQITEINVLKQSFNAQFYMELKISDGALDPDLAKDDNSFPLDADGKPTFLPSASWFLTQLDFNNAISYTKLDSRVRKDGDDLILAFRYEGTFAERLELEAFPFDAQDLVVSLAINCRTTGMTPVKLVVPCEADAHHSIDMEHFTLDDEWTLDVSGRCTAHTCKWASAHFGLCTRSAL